MSSENHEDVDDIKKRIGALNLDWTKRKETINTQRKLGMGVLESIESLDFPSIVSFSEVSGKSWVKEFQGGTMYSGATVGGPYGSGFMHTAWNKDEFSLEEIIESKGKRYMGVLLVDKRTKARHLHLGVHMPTKGGIWKTNADAISRCVTEYTTKREGIDFVSIAGDFNATPNDVVSHFSPDGLHFALTSEVFLPTTAMGNSIDNILSNREFNVDSIVVDDKNDRFSHYPLAATIQ